MLPTQSSIDNLDTPCLIRVLQHVSPQQQLVACGAVCSKWRKATREAITSIDISTCTQQKCYQLQQWAVYPPAVLHKLSLHGEPQPILQLQLSVLQHLRELLLDDVVMVAIAADGSMLNVFNLLPRLQQCTKLTFYAWGDPQLTGAEAAFQAMPALQDFDFDGGDVSPSQHLAELPTGLTRLCFFGQKVINTTTAATISKLTWLHVLEATAEAISFDTSVLANCTGLERVEIDIRQGDCSLSGAGGHVAPLLVFGRMPSLQHLRLQSESEDPEALLLATAAEVAAVSAWSNLTYLSLGDSEYCALPPAAYDSWFPAGRQCPHLQHVSMGVWVLGNTAAVQRMASACPGLKELQLLSSAEEGIQVEPACAAASWQAL